MNIIELLKSKEAHNLYNLKQLTIHIKNITTLSNEHFETISKKLSLCSSLSKLILEFNENKNTYNPVALNQLADVLLKCKNLHTLEIKFIDTKNNNQNIILEEILSVYNKFTNLILSLNKENYNQKTYGWNKFIHIFKNLRDLNSISISCNNHKFVTSKQLDELKNVLKELPIKSITLNEFNRGKISPQLWSSLCALFSEQPLLERLNLSNGSCLTYVRDDDPSWTLFCCSLKKCTQLQELIISNSNMCLLSRVQLEIFTSSLESCTALTKIDLSNNYFNTYSQERISVLFASLHKFTNLQHLNLSKNLIFSFSNTSINNIIDSLALCKNLKSLDLSYNELKSISITQLTNLKIALIGNNLHHLHLSNNSLGLLSEKHLLVFIEMLRGMYNLTTLNLQSNAIFKIAKLNIAPKFIEVFNKLDKLCTLNLSKNKLFFHNLQRWEFFANSLKHLQKLDLSDNKISTIHDWRKFCKIFTKMEHLTHVDLNPKKHSDIRLTLLYSHNLKITNLPHTHQHHQLTYKNRILLLRFYASLIYNLQDMKIKDCIPKILEFAGIPNKQLWQELIEGYEKKEIFFSSKKEYIQLPIEEREQHILVVKDITKCIRN